MEIFAPPLPPCHPIPFHPFTGWLAALAFLRVRPSLFNLMSHTVTHPYAHTSIFPPPPPPTPHPPTKNQSVLLDIIPLQIRRPPLPFHPATRPRRRRLLDRAAAAVEELQEPQGAGEGGSAALVLFLFFVLAVSLSLVRAVGGEGGGGGGGGGVLPCVCGRGWCFSMNTITRRGGKEGEGRTVLCMHVLLN